MKTIFKPLLILASIILFVFSCEGPAGQDGQDGDDAAFTTIFEIDAVNFVSENNFDASINFAIDNNIVVYESDIIEVYVVNPVKTAENGGLEVWEPLPSITNFEDGGYAEYSYNFILDESTNVFDVEIILESNDFSLLDSGFTENQIFRIAVIPTYNVNDIAETPNILENIQNASAIKL